MTVAAAGRLDSLLAERTEANRAFFGARAEDVARCCHRMAERFARYESAVATLLVVFATFCANS